MRQDALQEILNISMGQAADTLARLINERVHLSIPKLHTVQASSLNAFGKRLLRKPRGTLTRQSFNGLFRGEVLVCFEQGACHAKLANCMGFPDEPAGGRTSELTLELTNLLASACLKGVAEQFEGSLRFGPPSILSTSVTVIDYLERLKPLWKEALFMEISFSVDNLEMSTDLLICVAGQDTDELWSGVDRLLGLEAT